MASGFNWGIPVAVGVGVLTFGGVYAVMTSRSGGESETVVRADQEDDPPVDHSPPPAAGKAKSTAEGPAAKAPGNRPGSERKKIGTTPSLPPRWKDPVLALWKVPADPKSDNALLSPYRVELLAFDPSGERLITRSKLEINTWEIGTRTRVASFPVEQFKDGYVAPDASAVLVPTQKNDALRIFDPAGGALGTYSPEPPHRFNTGHLGRGGFTADGSRLVIYFSQGTTSGFYAVDTRTARGEKLPCTIQNRIHFHCRDVIPVMESGVLIVNSGVQPTKTKPHPVSLLELPTGVQTPVAGITVCPWSLEQGDGMQLSPNGRLLAVRDSEVVEVCDWRTGRRLFRWKESRHQCRLVRFTPDGKRLILVKVPLYDILHLGSGRGLESVPPTAILYEIATGDALGSFTLARFEGVSGLAVSPDGKRVGLGSGKLVAILDFETMFRVAALSPLSRETGGASTD